MPDNAIQEADKLLDEEFVEKETTKTPYTAKEAWHAIWRHVVPFQKEVHVLLALGLVSAMTNGSIPYVSGRFFDALIALSRGEHTMLWHTPLWAFLLAAWALTQLIANLIDWMMKNRQDSVRIQFRMHLEVQSFAHLLVVPIDYLKSANLGGITNTISSGGWRIGAIIRIVTTILPQFLSMLIGITLAASINLTLAAILSTGVIVYAMILFFMLQSIAEKDDWAVCTWNRAWEYATAAVHNAEMIKQAAAEIHETAKIHHMFFRRTFDAWMKRERHWANVGFFQRMVVFCTQLSVFLFSIHLIVAHVITVGELITVNAYAMMFFGPLVQLGNSWQEIQNGITAAIHLSKILDTATEIYHPLDARQPGGVAGAVTFHDVSFRYEAGHPLVLDHVSFDAVPGEVIALVGESGGGKSTTIGLIGAYYFPGEGAITVDGVDTRQHDLAALRSHIAVVPQEVTLFNDTIMNNIRYGMFDATDEDVLRAATDAYLTEFIATLPLGYDTMVGERGVKLSVGQKQRVAIARAMLRNPVILILDEPTSALDAQTEHHITEALERLMKGRTTFVIAHRLSTVRRANNILVFDKGRIAESGTHDELIKKEGGIYKNLHDHQIGLHG